MTTKIFTIASKKLDIKCDGCDAEKIRRRRDWSVDDFDAMAIRRGKSTKFDGGGVWSYAITFHVRNVTFPAISHSVSLLQTAMYTLH